MEVRHYMTGLRMTLFLRRTCRIRIGSSCRIINIRFRHMRRAFQMREATD